MPGACVHAGRGREDGLPGRAVNLYHINIRTIAIFFLSLCQVHAYTQGQGSRTAYLAELASGQTVSVADAAGRTRPAVVGRVKVGHLWRATFAECTSCCSPDRKLKLMSECYEDLHVRGGALPPDLFRWVRSLTLIKATAEDG